MKARKVPAGKLKPGHVLAVRTGGWAAWLIRLGAWLRGLPNLDNHVVVFHHYDAQGVPWGLEGRPGGVGWVDCRKYLAHPGTVVNYWQDLGLDGPQIADDALALLHTDYSWREIAGDVAADLGLPDPWGGAFAAGRPTEVVCSSYAALLYANRRKPHPCEGHEQGCQPADWTAWNERSAA